MLTCGEACPWFVSEFMGCGGFCCVAREESGVVRRVRRGSRCSLDLEDWRELQYDLEGPAPTGSL